MQLVDVRDKKLILVRLLFFMPIGIYVLLKHNNDDSPIYLQAFRLVSKTIILFAPLLIVLNFFANPENEQLAEDIDVFVCGVSQPVD